MLSNQLVLYSYIYVHVKYNFTYIRRHIMYSVHPCVWIHRPITVAQVGFGSCLVSYWSQSEVGWGPTPWLSLTCDFEPIIHHLLTSFAHL